MPLLIDAPPIPTNARVVGYKASVLILFQDDWGPEQWTHLFFRTEQAARDWLAERRQDSEHAFPRPARISPVYSA